MAWTRLALGLGAEPPVGGTAVLTDADGTPHRLTGTPLGAGRVESFGLPLRPRRLGLILGDPPRLHPPGIASVLRRLHRLTPAEADLAEALLRGETLAGYAARRGRSLNTVRTHLKAVCDKTGCRGQADLMRTLSRLTILRRD